MAKKIFLVIVTAGIIVAADAAAGVFLWQYLNKANQHQQAQISALSTQLNLQQTTTATLQNKLSQVIRSTQQNSTQQALNEITYLLDLANLYLQINHDINNASKSLRLAQHHLQMLADPSLLSLQQALASDLNRLNDAAQLDTVNVLLNLQTMDESISRLNLSASSAPLLTSPASATAVDVSKSWYQQSLRDLWDGFKNLFVIRYHSSVTPILSPEHREWIRENIALMLAQARWAVLQQKSRLYQLSLAQVQQWLMLYFPDNLERTKILERLAALAAINIAPPLPNITASLQAVQQALQDLTTVNPPAIITSPKLETPLPPATQPPPPTSTELTTPTGIEI